MTSGGSPTIFIFSAKECEPLCPPRNGRRESRRQKSLREHLPFRAQRLKVLLCIAAFRGLALARIPESAVPILGTDPLLLTAGICKTFLRADRLASYAVH